MKVQLSKDPLFQIKDSPLKQIKSKQIQRQRSQRFQKMNFFGKKKQLNLQIIDPLPNELRLYRTQTTYKKSVQGSKASQSLKKYIIQQQQNLRCLRLDRLQGQQQNVGPRKKLLQISLSPVNRQKDQQKQNKAINIPKIQDLFKNQSKQYLLYENKMLYNRLSKAINGMGQSINKLRSYSVVQNQPSKISSSGLGAGASASNWTTVLSLGEGKSINGNIQEEEIDKRIQKKMMRSKVLQQKIYHEKRQKLSHAESSQTKSNDMSFFLRPLQKPKQKVNLQGVKSYPFKKGNINMSLTPATSLLFELHDMSDNKQKKQSQLAGLLKNSYQNRDSILSQKQIFYQKQTNFADLSPSNQFKLRQLMNKKLDHRLQLSKQQVNKYIDYLQEIKDYHVILADNILQVLREVRKLLLSGKVMKMKDLQHVLIKYTKEQMDYYPNNKIVSKLRDMMI